MNISELTGLIWAIAGLLGTGSIAIYLWRRPDSALKIRHRDAELQLGGNSRANELPQPVAQSSSLSEVADQIASSASPGSEAVAGTVHEGTSFMRAYQLLKDGSYEEGLKLLQEESLSMPDLRKRIGLLAFGQYLAAEKGSLQALHDLRESSRINPDVYEVRLWLGITQYTLGEYASSSNELDVAYSLANNDEDRSTVEIWRARHLRKLKGAAAAASSLTTSVRRISEGKARARLISQTAAYLLEGENSDKEMAFSF